MARFFKLGDELHLPGNWKSEVILYRQINCYLTNEGIQFEFSAKEDNTTASLNNFIKGIRDRPPMALGRESPLDIKVSKRCYVVFQLSGEYNWTFDPRHDAVTTKNRRETTYFGLKHVRPRRLGDPIGAPVVATDGYIEDCKIAYFAVEPSSKARKDPFNLHVRLGQVSNEGIPRGDIVIIIDPDIRNTGGTD